MVHPTMEQKFDILIVGAGPIGLLLAHILSLSGLSVHIIEQHTLSSQIQRGRAAMLAPRTCELLDQISLLDPLLQKGYITRGQVHYNSLGERLDENVSRYAGSGITDTFFDFLLLVRQKYTEAAIREGYKRVSGGNEVSYGTSLVNYSINDDNNEDEYPITATLSIPTSSSSGTTSTHTSVNSKFLIGADGSHSLVRQLAGIPFTGPKTPHHFIRIDGIIASNLPNHRSSGTIGIESASHGSVLWACLDHRRTRIGFAFPPRLWQEKGAQVTEDDVVAEAKKAVKPFALEFETVDWWTAYS
ncbi:MAG: hypothetical protein Q9174_005460, partial [Haloplaca sp. 1 TL-2023]